MGDNNPNAQIEANLLEGKNRYASAGTTLQDIKHDLDSIAAGLQSSWLGKASQDFQDKRGQLTTTVQSASDVLQKGSISIGKMYDSYLEADEKQKEQKEAQETLELFMGVFMLVTALLGLIGPILEAADLLFAAEIEALDIVVEAGDVGHLGRAGLRAGQQPGRVAGHDPGQEERHQGDAPQDEHHEREAPRDEHAHGPAPPVSRPG